jgi:hypothetical protein
MIPEKKKERKLPNSLYETDITLIPKPDKEKNHEEIYKPISIMNS